MTVIDATPSFTAARSLDQLSEPAVAIRARTVAIARGATRYAKHVGEFAIAKLRLGATPAEAIDAARDLAERWRTEPPALSFLIDGLTVSLADMAEANADDPGFVAWLMSAKPGDSTVSDGGILVTALGLPA